MINIGKRVSEKDLIQFLKHTLTSKYNFRFNDDSMEKILDGIEAGINSLIEESYAFKLFGFNFVPTMNCGKIYKNIHNGEIEYSRPYYSLKIKIPSKYAKELKEKTAFSTLDLPEKFGITDEEYKEGLKKYNFIKEN